MKQVGFKHIWEVIYGTKKIQFPHIPTKCRPFHQKWIPWTFNKILNPNLNEIDKLLKPL